MPDPRDQISPEDTAALRDRAEAQLRWQQDQFALTGESPPPAAEVQRLYHELQVHQIELELQNQVLLETRRQLEQSLETYTDLYDFAPVAFFTLNADATICEVNLAGAALLGRPRAELAHHRLALSLAAESRAAFADFFDRMNNGTGKESCELVLAGAGGPPRYVHAEGVCMTTGTEARCRIAVIDITRRKQDEQQIQALNAGLEQRVAERTVALEAEIVERKRIEQDLRDSEQRYRLLNADLERQVDERTAELRAANTELNRLATTDALTGIWNRRHFERTAQVEIARVERYGGPLSLLMFDIDHFKAINDRFGHGRGDQVLVELALLVRGHLRTVDVLARWGGEEFLILVPQSGASEGRRLAEKLRALVAGWPFQEVGRVTVSLGVAERQGKESFDAWIKRADDALYAAKAGGRDQVYVDQSADVEGPPVTA